MTVLNAVLIYSQNLIRDKALNITGASTMCRSIFPTYLCLRLPLNALKTLLLSHINFAHSHGI